MAYNRYQFETSPRKIEPEYEKKAKTSQRKDVSKDKNQKQVANKNNKVNSKAKIKAKVVLYVFVAFAILIAISYRDSQITEVFNRKEALKKELSVAQKENEQLKISIENSLNLNTVEQLAKEKLGMQKLNNKQKIYVSLDKKDYIEAATEEVLMEENTSVWDKIVGTLTGTNK